MPRPRFSDWIITPTPITIPKGDSYNLDIDFTDTFYPQIMIKQTYAATAATTGCSVTIYPGFAVDVTGTIEYVDNGDTISMVTPTASQGTTQVTRTGFSVNEERYPKRSRFKIVNNDATNSVTVFVAGDR